MDIRKIRKEFKLSQEDFAKLIGVSRHTVMNYESGAAIPPNKVEFMSKLFDKLRNGDSTGLEEIYKGNIEEPSEKYQTAAGRERYIESLERIIKSKDEQIKTLSDSVSFLKSLIEKK